MDVTVGLKSQGACSLRTATNSTVISRSVASRVSITVAASALVRPPMPVIRHITS